jgi:hypothetical protein
LGVLSSCGFENHKRGVNSQSNAIVLKNPLAALETTKEEKKYIYITKAYKFLTFKTHDCDHEVIINYIEGKSKKSIK